MLVSSSMLDHRSIMRYLLLKLLPSAFSQRGYKLVDFTTIGRLFLNISLLGIGVMVALSIYAAIVLPYVLRITIDLEIYNPRAIHIGAFSGFTSFMCMTIAIWPVFGWLSFPMMFTLLLGFLNTGHFLPNHQISIMKMIIKGGLVFGGIFVGAFFSHKFIEHEGYWHYWNFKI